MPVEIGLWRLGETPERVSMVSMERESQLEDTLAADISILDPNLLLIGRQVLTAYGTYVDLLAMRPDGTLVVIELKRDRTPRDVVAQLLDYGSWVDTLAYDDITEAYAEKNGGKRLEKGFAEKFDTSAPAKINESHELIVVASEVDPSTERIINYLSDNYGVPVNAVFFRYFRDGDREYLSRTWLVDPQEAEVKAARTPRRKSSEPWSGRDYYVAIGTAEGEDPHRDWEDCRTYGFVSGGQSVWAAKHIQNLPAGARVFAMCPKKGYVGVGIVKEAAIPVRKFTVMVNGTKTPVLDAPLKATKMAENADDLELCEYVARVEWLKAVPKEQAYWEKGLFANQLPACKLSNRFTLERVAEHFGIED